MLESLEGYDFQCHEHVHIDFDPHVSTLVGESDQGKSAIVRLLYWIMTNQLRGDYFIRHGADSVKGVLRLDGHEIVREKGKGKNLYQLDGESPYEAFGMGVPEDIQKLVNTNRTNFQLQLDAPYLFSLSPGDVSKELNSVVNLDLIDSVLSSLSGESKKARISVQVSEERLEQARKRRDELKWIKRADLLLKSLEESEKELDQKREEIDSLKALLTELEAAGEALKGADATIMAMEAVVEAGNACWRMIMERDALAALLQEIAAIDKKIEAASGEAVRMKEDLEKKLEGKCPVCGSEAEAVLWV